MGTVDGRDDTLKTNAKLFTFCCDLYVGQTMNTFHQHNVEADTNARGKHKIEVFFHLAEHCVVIPAGKNRYLVDVGWETIEDVGQRTIEIELDPCLKVEEFKGSEDPICGWVSRGYHQKEASTTLVGRCTGEGNICLVCRIYIR